MSDYASIEETRHEVLRNLATKLSEQAAREVIQRIKSLPEKCRLSGAESRFEDVWDEFKEQIQHEKAPFFNAYEETIFALCRDVVSKLAEAELKLIWVWSVNFANKWAQRDEVTAANFEISDVVDELYGRVTGIAANEPLGEDLEQEVFSRWPGSWPGQSWVAIDDVGDAGAWLEQSLGEPANEVLRNLDGWEQSMAQGLAESYEEALDQYGCSMPWEVDGEWSEEEVDTCRTEIQQEFVAFLRHWRERALDLL